jgi:hypothetical protein
VDFRVLHADPLDPGPTGFTLRFSAALFLGDSGSSVFEHATNGLEVVDQDGRSWPVAAGNYDEVHAAISYLFLDALPQGTYTLRLPDSNPLTDLAGNAAISPTMPHGVLATFAVAPDTRARRPDGSLAVPASILATVAPGARSEDLGPLIPNLTLAGINRSLTIQPGETVALRFVSLYRDFYRLAIQYDGGPLHVDMVGPDGIANEIDPGASGQENALAPDLRPGVYFARFTATGDTPVTLTTGLSIGAFGWDSLLANGLGQGPALNLRLISTDAPASFALGDPASSGQYAYSAASSTSGAFAGPFAAGAVTSAHLPATVVLNRSGLPEAEAALVSSSPSGLSLDVGGAPVGLPSAGADHVAAVSPGVGSGSVALALAGPGLGQSISSPLAFRGDFAPDDAPAPSSPAEPPAPATDGSMTQESAAPILPTPGDESRSPGNESAKSDPDVGSASWSPASPEIPAEAALSPASFSAAAPSSDPEAGEQDAGLSPWIFGIAGATAIAARQVLRRWKSRRRPMTHPAGFIPAPHAVPTRVRV